MLNLVWPRSAVRSLLWIQIIAVTDIMAVSARLRLPELARRAPFAPRFQLRQIELRNVSFSLCAHTPHVETFVDAPK
jgi:hypothetical protein